MSVSFVFVCIGKPCQPRAPDLCIWRQLPGRHSAVWQHYTWMGPLSH